MRNTGGLLAKLSNCYTTFSLISTNALLIFLLLNFLAAGYLDLVSSRRKASSEAGTPFGHRKYDRSLDAVYPDMDKSEIAQLIKETRKVSQEYDSY
ncbi:MAG: hypothetical protein FJY85_06235, partial [Deltaproteobacteria bacterium]|nr:hypothetical protein [Deltaproteobacteria bacterium]